VNDKIINIKSMKFLILLLISSLTISASQAGLFKPEDFNSFCQKAKSFTQKEIAAELGSRLSLLKKDGINIGHLKRIDLNTISNIINKSISLGHGALEFFTDIEFAKNNSCVFFLSKDLLKLVYQKFTLHGLWMINAPLNGGDSLKMDFLIVGDSKLIIGYPKKETIKVLDYNFYTGKFVYTKYMSMDIVNRPGVRGLFNIKSFDERRGKLRPFKGPMSASINSLSIKGNKILIKYQWMFNKELTIAKTLIESKDKSVAKLIKK